MNVYQDLFGGWNAETTLETTDACTIKAYSTTEFGQLVSEILEIVKGKNGAYTRSRTLTNRVDFPKDCDNLEEWVIAEHRKVINQWAMRTQPLTWSDICQA